MKQNTHASLKPTNLRDSVRQELFIKVMETTLQAKGFASMTHYNLVHKFILVLQAMKIPDAKAAEEKERKNLKKIPA